MIVMLLNMQIHSRDFFRIYDFEMGIGKAYTKSN